MRVWVLSALTAVSVAFTSSFTMAQAQSVQDAPSTISGTVASPDGARLPHATITVTDLASSRVYRGTSNELGAFVLQRLPAGTYLVLVEFPGFDAIAINDVTIGGDGAAHLEVVLEPAAVRELVTVSSALPRDSVEVTQVRESPARDVGELLADSAGLWSLRKGAIAADVVVRGLQSRDLNVLIDGERLYGACPNHMDPPAFHVDFSQVERVDVGKGPFDVRYQGSLGGIVNVVTKRADAGWHATTALGAGSHGFANPSATVSYGGETLSVLGGVSYRRSGPYTDGRGDLMTNGAGYRGDASDSDAFRASTAWGRVAWTPAPGHEIETSYTAQRTDHILYPYLQMDAIWDNADRAAVDYDGPSMGPFSDLKGQFYVAAVDHWMTDAYRTSSASAPRAYSMGTDATTLTMGGRIEARMARTTIGGEAFRRNWNAETSMAGMSYTPQFSIPDVDVDSAGVFVEYARPIGLRAALDLGGRIDRVSSAADPARANIALYRAYHNTTTLSRSDVLPSGRAKLTVEVTRDLEVAASVGHTARVAEPNERFFALRRMGTDWVGNPDLDPVRNSGLDIAVSFERPRVTLTTNVYVNAVNDYVAVYGAPRQAMVPGVMNPTARSYANVDARLRGFEASGSVTIRAPFSLSGDLSYVRGTMTPRPELGITSRDLAETPPLRARLRARVDDGRFFAELEGVASAGQTRVDSSLGEAETPSYAIANLNGGFERGRLSVTVGVANLLDTYYVEHLSYQRDPYRSGVRVAEPGRNVFTNLSWRF